MKKFWKKIQKKGGVGFTMIELLIVIAVLGVLAVAVLSAINPIEQINRGRDTGSRSDAEQFLSAIDRFYTAQEIYPWQTKDDVLTTTAPVAWQAVEDAWLDTDGVAVLPKLATEGTGELKQAFINRIDGLPDDYKLQVHMRGQPGDSVYVCFLVRSGSFKTEAKNRCTDDGAGGACTNLPEDLLDVANCGDLICNADSPYICLP